MGEEVGEKGQDHFYLHQEPPRLTGHILKVVSRFIHLFTYRNPFFTNFIIIDRLLQVRNALERMIIDNEWPTLMSDLRRRSPTAYAKAASVRRFIRSDGFWGTCENFLYMVIPVVKALRLFDGKALATGMA